MSLHLHDTLRELDVTCDLSLIQIKLFGFLPPTSISARSGELLPAVSFKLASYNVGNKTHRRFQYLIGASSQF